MRLAKVMRYLYYLLACFAELSGSAQSQLGLATGVGFFFMAGYDESSGFAEHEMKSPALSLSAFVRSSARPVGFALHVGYLHKSINGAWRQGGLGAGGSMNGDFSLHAMRIAMAPEFAKDSTSRAAIRIGIEARLAFAGRFKGSASAYHMNPQYGPNYSAEDTVMSVAGLEALLFFGVRVNASAGDQYTTTVEPYLAFAPTSAMVGGGPKTRWIEFGVGVGVGRKGKRKPLEQPAL